MRERFEIAILADKPNLAIIGEKAKRLPHVSNIAFVGLDRQQLFLALDQAGIACSPGSACASGSSVPSPVHLAMGLQPGVISSALRFSFGVQTTAAEVDESIRRILQVCNNLRSQKQS
jgi:cysteine desulfurase